MARPHNALSAHERSADDGTVELRAPHIGRFVACVETHQIIEGEQPLGVLHVLQTRHTLLAPKGVSGRVVTRLTRRERPVAYGDLLVALAPVDELGAAIAQIDDDAHDLGEGQFIWRASIDGLFYRSASPEDPPFVHIGDEIAPGDTIGLVEVMKFFYPALYEESGPSRLVDILVEDASPVSAGDALFVMERI